MPTFLWLPEGPLPRHLLLCTHTPTLSSLRKAIVLQLGKNHPALSPLGTTGNVLWGPPLKTNSRPIGVASGQRVLAPTGTDSRVGQRLDTSLHQAPSLSCGDLVGVWGGRDSHLRGDQVCWPPMAWLGGWETLAGADAGPPGPSQPYPPSPSSMWLPPPGASCCARPASGSSPSCPAPALPSSCPWPVCSGSGRSTTCARSTHPRGAGWRSR